MPPYKKQHYLPAAYLKYFSADQNMISRKSWVWRHDVKSSVLVPIESQCAGDYFYTKEKAAESERHFGEFETIYCECVDRLKSEGKLDGSAGGKLLMLILHFHLRSDAWDNLTGKEELDAYKLRETTFLSKVMLGVNPEGKDIISELNNNWVFDLKFSTRTGQFITSDNPSILITLGDHDPVPRLVFLPVTPGCIAMGFDRRFLQIRVGSITAEDEQLFNDFQIASARRCLYSCAEGPEETSDLIRMHFEHRKKPRGMIDGINWDTTLLQFFPGRQFSFLRRTPPLL